MSKTLYQEALADAKQLREIAEGNARQDVIDAVMPRIRKLFETNVLGVPDFEDEEVDGEMVADLVSPEVAPIADPSGVAAAITPPDADGKVTLDLDALATVAEPKTALPPKAVVPEPPPAPATPDGIEDELSASPDVRVMEPEYELSMESLKALKLLVDPGLFKSSADFRKQYAQLVRDVDACAKSSRSIRESASFRAKIGGLIGRIEDTYAYVQETKSALKDRARIEEKLEELYGKANRLMEAKTKKSLVTEEDLTIKLTGVPDDLNVDELGIDLITGEEEAEGEPADLDAEPMGDEGGDLGGEEGLESGAGESDEDMEEADMVELDENDVVEISESMLRSEIARMKKIHEYAADGHDVPADDFGGGKDEGDAWLDGEVSTDAKDNMVKQGSNTPKTVHESDEMDEDQDQMDEDQDQMDEQDDLDEGDDDQMDEDQDQMDELGLKRKESQYGFKAANHHSVQAEGRSLSSVLKREQRAQHETQKRLSLFKNEAQKARGTKKESVLKQRAMREAQRLEASKRRVSEIQKRLKLQKEGAANRNPRQPADDKAVVESLRKQLSETNLFNAKLLYTNKLLQNEALSPKQKAAVIERLDEARTLREAKLVYESLVKALSNKRPSLHEGTDRQSGGSSSRPTSPSSTVLTESVQTSRWARLAGIAK